MRTMQFCCPYCGKKYSVHREKLEDQRPEFHCRKCGTHFVVDVQRKNATPAGEFCQSEILKSPPKAIVCPKCQTLNNAMHEECRVCGVIMKRYRNDRERHEVNSSFSLEKEWQQVLEEFNDRALHQRFIDHCVERDALSFAMKKYQSLAELIPGDEIAEEMRLRIRKMANFELKKSDVELPSPSVLPNWCWSTLKWAPLVIGGVLFFIGLESYEFRNFAGLGAGLIVLSFGLWLSFR